MHVVDANEILLFTRVETWKQPKHSVTGDGYIEHGSHISLIKCSS